MEEVNDGYDILSESEKQSIYDLQKSFILSYVHNNENLSIDEWLQNEFKKNMLEMDEDEIASNSSEIIDTIEIIEKEKNNLDESIKIGRDKESWLASRLEEHTSHLSTQEAAKYLKEIDDVVEKANKDMILTITNKDGSLNQNPNLDGFIAEQRHVSDFNFKAAAQGGGYRAEVLRPEVGKTYSANSVDIVIKDSSGKIVHRYQVKYGKDAAATVKMIKEGNYRGQILVVPADQVEEVQKAFPNRKVVSQIGDGKIKSKPLTKAQVKELQHRGFMESDWSAIELKDIAGHVAKDVGKASLQGIAIGTGIYVLDNIIKGEEIDGEELVEKALSSGSDFGIKVATAGALKTATEKGVIKVIPKGTPAATFANIAFVGIENVKVAGDVIKGELTPMEGIDKMQQTTAACVSGIVASKHGAGIGLALGGIFGPIGSAIGGFAGSVVGYMAGSKVGEMVIKGAQKLRDTAIEIASEAWEGIKSIGSSIKDALFGWL